MVEPLVHRIIITGLFGRYDYDLTSPSGEAQRLVLLYGENGSGKTNILRIVWHLLSPANNRSHRHALQELRFRTVHLFLADGSIITANRERGTRGPYTIGVQGRHEIAPTEWPTETSVDHWELDELLDRRIDVPDNLRTDLERAIGQKSYIAFLNDLGANPLFLADDRNIYSDDLDAPRSSVSEMVNAAALGRDLSRYPYSGRPPRPEDAQSVVAFEANNAMKRADEILRRITIGGTTSGSANANTVYLEVLQRLNDVPELGPDVKPSRLRSDLTRRLAEVGERSRAFEELGLVPSLLAKDFIDSLKSLNDQAIPVANGILTPFLTSLSARLDALELAEQLIRVFLDEVNKFLSGKKLSFTPANGLHIVISDSEGQLTTAELSSGERQIVLLLCNALLAARQGTRIFLIDEPELSLNVRWQRLIGSALLNLTTGSSIQFIVATHSIELLSKFRSSIVELKPLDLPAE